MSEFNKLPERLNERPDCVYKYLCADRAISILDRLLIRFSQPSVLNDALEFKPQLEGLGTRTDVERFMRKMLPLKMPELIGQINAANSPERADQIISSIVSQGADWMESQPGRYDNSVKDLYARLDRDIGVLSLSEAPASALMWSHYASGGFGFLIEFDAQHSWFWDKRAPRDSFNHLRQVSYHDRTPAYFLNLPDDIALYTKTPDWSYETEWRIIRRLSEAAGKEGPDRYGKDVLLFAIPPDAINSVVIGYRSTAESVKQLKEVVHAHSELSHVMFKKAILRDNGSIDVQPSF